MVRAAVCGEVELMTIDNWAQVTRLDFVAVPGGHLAAKNTSLAAWMLERMLSAKNAD